MTKKLSELDISELKIRKIDFDEDESQKLTMEKIYMIANKTPIDWASLFVYCYEQLENLDYGEINERLAEMKELYLGINRNLQEHNRPIEYGKHIYFDKLMKIVNDNINDVREVINFTFSKVLYEESMSQFQGKFQ